jgi:hypothetical protein
MTTVVKDKPRQAEKADPLTVMSESLERAKQDAARLTVRDWRRLRQMRSEITKLTRVLKGR